MQTRLDRLRAALVEAELDAIIVSSPVDDVFGNQSHNRRWVSGFTGSTGHALVTMEKALLVADFRYTEQAESECRSFGYEVFPRKGAMKEWWPAACDAAGLAGRSLAMSGADFSLEEYEDFLKATREMDEDAAPYLVKHSGVIEDLRIHKDDAEMASLQRAIDIGDAAMRRVQELAMPGMTELELAALVEREVRAAGGEGLSFNTIAAAGPAGAMPHAQPGTALLGEGRPIVVDMGVRADGYCSDLTRTFVIGRPDARFGEIYDIVFEAQRNAIEKLESGMSGKDAHELAASVIDAAGYGEQFGHGLGHGVGLQVHERPYLGRTSEDTLEEGMVFTVEPGIYLPGWGGIRIEDVVVLENGRARVLSHAPKLAPAGV
jgi:Xaa-Pro aminopeptidase